MKDNNPLAPFLEQDGPIILDGGLATELEKRGHDLANDLWSARLLINAPGVIREVHLDYLRAGADCIISASYQGTIAGFMSRGLSEIEAKRTLKSSVELAVEARNSFWSKPENQAGRLKPIVAASVGPYGAYLADGSEFTGDYELEEAELKEFHEQRWRILAASPADILACETIPSSAEARALRELLRETPDRYAWFSFSCKDGKHISDGTPLTEVASMLNGQESVVAIGINCTSPRFIADLIAEARKATGKPIIVYPNSGEKYDVSQRRWVGEAKTGEFVDASVEWRATGATLIGGCCRTGPEHIRLIRQRLTT